MNFHEIFVSEKLWDKKQLIIYWSDLNLGPHQGMFSLNLYVHSSMHINSRVNTRWRHSLILSSVLR